MTLVQHVYTSVIFIPCVDWRDHHCKTQSYSTTTKISLMLSLYSHIQPFSSTFLSPTSGNHYSVFVSEMIKSLFLFVAEQYSVCVYYSFNFVCVLSIYINRTKLFYPFATRKNQHYVFDSSLLIIVDLFINSIRLQFQHPIQEYVNQ